MPRAALAEAPIYRGGEQLQPWQRAFVVRFLQDRRRFGKARLLLADEVGVGKTLSMAGSAVVSALLGTAPRLRPFSSYADVSMAGGNEGQAGRALRRVVFRGKSVGERGRPHVIPPGRI